MRTVGMATPSSHGKIKGSEVICANRWLAGMPSMAEDEAAQLASGGSVHPSGCSQCRVLSCPELPPDVCGNGAPMSSEELLSAHLLSCSYPRIAADALPRHPPGFRVNFLIKSSAAFFGDYRPLININRPLSVSTIRLFFFSLDFRFRLYLFARYAIQVSGCSCRRRRRGFR